VRLHRIAVLTVLALAACGGNPPTRAEFTAAADKVCADHNERFNEIFADISGPLSDDELREMFDNYTDVYEDLADELADLDPPDGVRAIARYLDRLERNVRGLRAGLEEDRLKSDGFESARYNSMMEARDLALEAGLKVCASLES
jgi:hypothetical protein